MADERLLDFPSKPSPIPADIIYCGDSDDGFNEVQITIEELIAAYPGLLSIGELTTVADRMIYTTGANTYAVVSAPAYGRSLLSAPSASDARTLIGAVNKAGDTMTGYLILNGDPIVDLGAATKQYVDTELGDYVPLAGGTMTGFLTLNADPELDLEAATKQYVDNLSNKIPESTISASNYDVPTDLTNVFLLFDSASPQTITFTDASGNYEQGNWFYFTQDGTGQLDVISNNVTFYPDHVFEEPIQQHELIFVLSAGTNEFYVQRNVNLLQVRSIGANYPIAKSDNNVVLLLDSAGSIDITFDSATNFEVGQNLYMIKRNSGTVTFAPLGSTVFIPTDIEDINPALNELIHAIYLGSNIWSFTRIQNPQFLDYIESYLIANLSQKSNIDYNDNFVFGDTSASDVLKYADFGTVKGRNILTSGDSSRNMEADDSARHIILTAAASTTYTLVKDELSIGQSVKLTVYNGLGENLTIATGTGVQIANSFSNNVVLDLETVKLTRIADDGTDNVFLIERYTLGNAPQIIGDLLVSGNIESDSLSVDEITQKTPAAATSFSITDQVTFGTTMEANYGRFNQIALPLDDPEDSILVDDPVVFNYDILVADIRSNAPLQNINLRPESGTVTSIENPTKWNGATNDEIPYYVASSTWTVTVGDASANNFTASNQVGRYIRVEDLIFFWIRYSWSNKGSASGDLRISLPTTIANIASSRWSFTVGDLVNVTFSEMVGAFTLNNVNYFNLELIRSGTTSLTLTAADCGTTGSLYISGNYQSQ